MRQFLKVLLVFTNCFLIVSLASAQSRNEVTGTVTDESGVPLAGVSVIIKNTTNGTATDFDGNFSIDAAPSDVLSFSYIGYKPLEINVGQQSNIIVTMEENASVLDEVVVVGYGTSTRRDVTGSIASVSGAEIAEVPVADAAQALQGKLAGVSVTTQDGRPGADVSIKVRGGGSISQSNQPLFIVDGFPVSSISNIPGNQIKSIDVLKDASSTAIYGARGANGVIIVTTKGGKIGKTTVSYDGYTQYSYIPEYIPVMDSYDYILFNWAYGSAIGDQYADAWEKLWKIGRYEGSNTAGIDYYKNVNSRDFTKELYNSAISQNHNINISSGNENTRYLLSLNHIDQEGNKVRSFYKRTNLQLKLDQKINDKLDLSLNTRFSQVQNGNNDGNSNAYWFRPVDTADILGDSDVTSNTQLGDYNRVLQDTFNPVSLLNDSDDETKSRSLVLNTALTWKVLNGLTAKADLGLSSNWGSEKEWTGAYVNNYFTGDGEQTFGGDARVRSSQGWNLRLVNTLNYEVQGLGENHDLSFLAGMEIADSGSEYVEAVGVRYPKAYDSERAWANMRDSNSDFPDLNFYRTYVAPANRLQSYFGRANYSLLDKYLLTATFRADGSSRFAPSNRWGYFPAAAFAWRISEESFLQDAGWLDDLKLRLSYGSVGSDAISAELWKQSWASQKGTYSINEQLQPQYRPASSLIANENLKWETTITRNIGLDFTLFSNRLSGTVEVYKNTVKDLLLVTPVSDLTGFQFTQDNIGSTSNKGIEISLSGGLVDTEDFTLNGSINFNLNRGNVDELDEGINGEYKSQFGGVRHAPGSGDYYLTVGEPVGLYRGWEHDGWYTTDDFNYDPATQIYTLKESIPDYASGLLPNIYGTFSNKPGDQTAYPGVQKVKDSNGDGTIDEEDLGVIGNANPVHTGGFSFSGNYKAFDFGLNFVWSYGNDIYNATHVEAYLGNKEAGLFRNRFQELAGHYKIYDVVDGQLTPVVDPDALDALNANATTFLPYPESSINTTFGIEDGSFLRLNTLTLGYTVPNSGNIGLNKLRIYGSVFNVFTLTSYSGFDPEVNVNPDPDPDSGRYYPTPGLDYGSYPRPRTFTLGVNIEF
ncbi:SusC/RagA family TonB-linked outer membrane protein [Pseudozobellia thermophila]|uniref:TonB-linked outer membrane protein, SusC/RagA family n=1 Tax=Pseudozobellia thermophila TaxID=192903 RepID=A0A1M6CBM9_9FLAO|nr:TonB-dependent receptor [Pseudozobellia thermophila]SHI58419.1 TonB-linked outer membrane protein, SusC/RagA family [Pseudozobellia thermophila]